MELNYVIVKMLQMLLSANGDLPILSAMESLDVTRRILLYNLKKLNYNLKVNGFSQIEIMEDRLLLDVSRGCEIKEALLVCSNGSIQNYVLSQDERKIVILLIVGLASNNLTLDELAAILDISKNTAVSDIAHLKEELAEYGLALNNKVKQGYCLAGDELTIRYCLYEYMSKAQSSHMQAFMDKVFLSAVNLKTGLQITNDFFQVIYESIEEAEFITGLSFNHNSIREVVYYVLLIFCRSKIGKLYINDEFLSTMKEYEAASLIMSRLKECGIVIPEEEHSYLATVILGEKCYSYHDVAAQPTINLGEFTNDLIDNFENTACVQFEDRDVLAGQLLIHIRPMYYRLKYQIRVNNCYSNDIKKEYPDIFRYTRTAVKLVERRYGFLISDEEIAYLCIYFVSWMTRQKQSDHPRRGKILIVCGAGIGTSLFLQHQITDIVGKNYTIEIKEFRDSSVYDAVYYDLILSTVDLPFDSAKIMKVDAVLTAVHKNKILNWCFPNVTIADDSCIEDIITLVEQCAIIKNRPKMVMTLRKYLESYGEIQKIRLKDVLTANMVLISNESADSSTAIRIACEPLIAGGFVDRDYPESILQIIEEKGLYSEIAPGVLLAHAHPTMRVRGVGLSLSIFRQGVSFGHNEKEKIKIIFTLCTPNNQAHYFVLKDLLNLLSENDLVPTLKACDFASTLELYQYLSSKL